MLAFLRVRFMDECVGTHRYPAPRHSMRQAIGYLGSSGRLTSANSGHANIAA